jgi:hypothetical protein
MYSFSFILYNKKFMYIKQIDIRIRSKQVRKNTIYILFVMYVKSQHQISTIQFCHNSYSLFVGQPKSKRRALLAVWLRINWQDMQGDSKSKRQHQLLCFHFIQKLLWHLAAILKFEPNKVGADLANNIPFDLRPFHSAI